MPKSVWLMYAVILFNLALMTRAYGFDALIWATGACVLSWAAALMHERYTYR